MYNIVKTYVFMFSKSYILTQLRPFHFPIFNAVGFFPSLIKIIWLFLPTTTFYVFSFEEVIELLRNLA